MPSIFGNANKITGVVTKTGDNATQGVVGIKSVTKAISTSDFSTIKGALSGSQNALGGMKSVAAALGNKKLMKTLGQAGTVLRQSNRLNQSYQNLKKALGVKDGKKVLQNGGLKDGLKKAPIPLRPKPADPYQSLTSEPNGFTKQDFLREMLARPDPLLSFEWIGVLQDAANPTGVIPSIYIDAIDTPSLSIDKTGVFRQGSNTFFAGVQSVSEVSVTLYSDRTGKAMRFASSWFDHTIANANGNYNLPRDYKKELIIYMFDVERRVVVSLHLHGVFPINWDPYALNDSAEPLKTRLTLSVDSIEFKDVV
jgi:hypothetical protein